MQVTGAAAKCMLDQVCTSRPRSIQVVAASLPSVTCIHPLFTQRLAEASSVYNTFVSCSGPSLSCDCVSVREMGSFPHFDFEGKPSVEKNQHPSSHDLFLLCNPDLFLVKMIGSNHLRLEHR